MEEQQKKKEGSNMYESRQNQPPYVSQMQPMMQEAYGGGLYGKDDEKEVDVKTKKKEAKNIENEPQQHNQPASDTQSADGPDEVKTMKPKHKQPPSSGDRDIDITGQSYIQ
ncbi:hypothetical protein EUTSA_v10009649mg [Eutrema salsugineum]|uniref:Uncharacterized protein n=1 Tax=Eutrema salsugineum TaxID=72664 RepID=V4KY02_EUTSA|nr:uncharacterized protein LOC18994173 [Eutrema salsugineum]ESQ36209.1 hypothetical protein EUTSA_v10009649mg [Eutrema salsugineum]